jgi:hypothetical protein
MTRRELLALLAFSSARPVFGQGVSSRGVRPQPRGKPSGRPFQARFTDVARQAGLTEPIVYGGAESKRYIIEVVGCGVAFLDYDNDGWLDVFLLSGTRLEGAPEGATNRLYKNNRDGTFTDVTAKAGLGGVDGFVTAAAWGDVDGDGRLDLFLARYVDDRAEGKLFCGDPATGRRVYCPPMMYPGSHPLLFRNGADGVFRDVTRESGLGDAVGRGLGAVFVDVDLDGKLDLYVANDEVLNFLFRNLGGGRFEDISIVSGTAFDPLGNPQGGMGTDAGDLDGDGLPDLVVANYENEANAYYRNLGSGVFEDLSASSGFGPPAVNFVGFGLNLLDAENDGDLDAFIANGHIFEKPQRQGTTYAERPFLMWNDGTGRFRERGCGPAFARELVGRGAAVADYDNDGDLDVAVSNSGGPLELLRNDGGKGRWVGVRLVGRGSNRQGVGARLVAETPSGRKLTRLAVAGNSYLSSSDPRILFGLGQEESIRRLTIFWPSGTVQTVDGLAAGKYHRIEESASPPKP